MTINEIETRTGLERATVRYYESEGLIKPAREPNGYRNYSNADLEKLLKIKLLRSLNFSLEDIKSMDADGTDFPDRLRARVKSLEAREADIGDARRVLNLMLQNGASYADLDTGRYLAALESAPERPPALPPAPSRVPEPVEEHPEWEPAPWRRFFARMVDWGILELAYLFVSAKLLSIPYSNGFGYTVVLDLILMAATLLIEPILLRTCGATPGKWLMGLRVTDPEGEKLTLGAAFRRTWGVLLWGEGLMIPLLSPWRTVRSFLVCRRGEELPWEGGSQVAQSDFVLWRGFAFVGSQLLELFLAALILAQAMLPAARGDLTPARLAGNVNRYMEYNLEGASDWRLQTDGAWTEASEPDPHVIYVSMYGEIEPVPVELTVEDGVVTGLHWRQTAEASAGLGPYESMSQIVRALTFSLAGADRSESFFALLDLERTAALPDFAGFTLKYGGWTVTCDTFSGDASSTFSGNGVLYFPEGARDTTFGVELTITKTG